MPNQKALAAILQSEPLDMAKLLKHLSALSIKELVSLCAQTPVLAEKLIDPKLENYWQLFLKNFQVIPDTPTFRMAPQSYTYCGDLVIGMLFFSLSKKDPQFLPYAMHHDSFHAYYKTINYFSTNLLSKDLDENAFLEAQRAFYHFLQEAKEPLYRHEGAGLLLLASAYYSMAIAASRQKQLSIAEVTIYEALKLTHAAKKLTESENSYHNAYLGKGLMMSNPLGLDSFDKIIKALSRQADKLLTLDRRVSVIDDAREFISQFKPKKRLIYKKGGQLSHFFSKQIAGDRNGADTSAYFSKK